MAKKKKVVPRYAVNISMKAWDIAKAGAAVKLIAGNGALAVPRALWEPRLDVIDEFFGGVRRNRWVHNKSKGARSDLNDGPLKLFTGS